MIFLFNIVIFHTNDSLVYQRYPLVIYRSKLENHHVRWVSHHFYHLFLWAMASIAKRLASELTGRG
jgi:hypothetical protein